MTQTSHLKNIIILFGLDVLIPPAQLIIIYLSPIRLIPSYSNNIKFHNIISFVIFSFLYIFIMFSRNAMLLAKSGSCLFIFLRFWLRLFWPWLQTTFLTLGIGAVFVITYHCLVSIVNHFELSLPLITAAGGFVWILVTWNHAHLKFSRSKIGLSNKQEKHLALLWNLVAPGNSHQILLF